MDSATPANTCLQRTWSKEQPELARTRTSEEESVKPPGPGGDKTKGLSSYNCLETQQSPQEATSRVGQRSHSLASPQSHQMGGPRSRGSRGAAHLVIVEDGVGHGVLAWHCGGPQLLHEEHLVGERGHDSCGPGQLVTRRLRREGSLTLPAWPGASVSLSLCLQQARAQPLTILDGPCFLYPVCQVSDEVKEEVVVRDTDDLGM